MLSLLNWETITSWSSLLLGSSTVVTYVLYRKQQKRLGNAEAFSKEVDALKNTISVMQQQMQYYEGRLTEMHKLIIGKDTYIASISQNMHMLEIKNSKSETAINKAYACNLRTESHPCPVLVRYKENAG